MVNEGTINNVQAFYQVRSWKERGGTVDLLLTSSTDKKIRLDLRAVKILGINEAMGEAQVSFQWQIDTLDIQPRKLFAQSRGTTSIWLEGATLSLSNNPRPCVTISRGHFTCMLTEVRESGLRSSKKRHLVSRWARESDLFSFSMWGDLCRS